MTWCLMHHVNYQNQQQISHSSPSSSHTFSLLSFTSECQRDWWQVTRIVTKGELGRSAERLRDQMEKLQLHSLHRFKGKAVMLEQQLTMADPSVRRLEREKQAAERRAEIAERRVSGTGRG